MGRRFDLTTPWRVAGLIALLLVLSTTAVWQTAANDLANQGTPAGSPVAVAETTLETPFGSVGHRGIACPMDLPKGDIDGETAICGQVIVPANWDHPGERTIPITYVRLLPTSLAPQPDPIIYLEGGPGGSALEDIEGLSKYFAKLRETREFVMYDQRGTLYSGNLDCPVDVEYGALASAIEAAGSPIADEATPTGATPEATPVPLIDQDPQAVLDAARQEAAAEGTPSCSTYFDEQGIDRTQYNTTASVKDLVALMVALDAPTTNLYGISYGSHIALAMQALYDSADAPAGLPPIRSVTIDGIVPMSTETLVDTPFATMYVTLRTLSLCEAAPECAAAYPDIRARAVELLKQAESDPITITGSDGTTQSLSVDDIRDMLIGHATTSTEPVTLIDFAKVAPYLPRLVDELSRGVGDTWFALKAGTIPMEAPEAATPSRNPLDPIAAETAQQAEDARELADRLDALAAMSQRAADSLAAGESTATFFINELTLAAKERPSFGGIGAALLRIVMASLVDSEATVENLASVISGLGFDQATVDRLTSILNYMTPDELKETQKLLASERVLEQLTQAIQMNQNTAVFCNDDYGDLDLVAAFDRYRSAEAPQLVTDIDVLTSYIIRCEQNNLAPASGLSNTPVTSSIPTFVVNGGIDVVTPEEWGDEVFASLQNAQTATVPMTGHGASATTECGQDMVRAFFDYPEQQVDTSCTVAMLPTFVMPDAPLAPPAQEPGA